MVLIILYALHGILLLTSDFGDGGGGGGMFIIGIFFQGIIFRLINSLNIFLAISLFYEFMFHHASHLKKHNKKTT